MWPGLFLLSLPLIHASIDCALQPILKGVSTKQSLGEGQKKLFLNEPNCKQRCVSETSFNCTAILWGGDATSDCYIYDRINLNQEIFVDQRVFILYVSVCDGEPIPSIGYCQFLLNQTGVTAPTGYSSVSPGMTTESSCREFCIAHYWGQNCDAFVVSTNMASTCTLYPSTPSTPLAGGTQNLWTKNCFPPPKNCEYTQWNEWTQCSVSCGGGSRIRNRGIMSEATNNGLQCMESEQSQTGSCGLSDCGGNCIYGEWTAFGSCNATCDITGVRNRTRMTIQGNGCLSSDMIEFKECASTIECGRSCIYSAWTEWSTCNSNCISNRSRTLEMGDSTACEIEYGPLVNGMICEGGQCIGSVTVPNNDNPATTAVNGVTPTIPSGGGATTPAGGHTGPNIQEPGCKVLSIDPSSRVSSKGYKAVGARQDCAWICQQETSFQCGAYITSGPGGPCVLQGEVDRPVTILSNSRYYLQDVNCKTNTSSSTGICSWQQVGKGTNPSFSAPNGFVSIGLTIDAPHCATLCMMNWPIYRPNPCVAYAWNPTIPFQSGHDNCFMYNWQAMANLTNGDYDLYRLQCPQ